MRIWIAKKSGVSVREQLAAQIMLGVISQDLKPGEKLLSIRAFAQRYRIHSNTVSAAYQDLVHRGWLELRKGSGVYVRPLEAYPDSHQELDRLVLRMFARAQASGYTLREIRECVDNWLPAAAPLRLLAFDPEPELQEILRAEVQEHVSIPVELVNLDDLAGGAVIALVSRARQLQAALPARTPRLLLRLRSIARSLEGQPRPAIESIITVVSRSATVLQWTRTVLLAVGLAPDALSFLTTAEPAWRTRLKSSRMIITDVVTARDVPSGYPVRVFRLIADSSQRELARFAAGM